MDCFWDSIVHPKKVKNIKRFLITDLLVSFYLGLVITISFIKNADLLWLFFPLSLAIAISLYVAYGVLRFGDLFHVRIVVYEPCEAKKVALLCGIFVLLGQLVYWMAYYPGGFNLDALGHWDQVHGMMELNDWHPVVVTGMYWVLTRIIDKVDFCIFFQIFFFSLSFTVLIKELSKRGISKIILYCISIIVSIMPSVGMNNVCIIKDVFFTICMIWLLVFLIRIEETKKLDREGKKNIVYITIVLTLLTLVRHNGVLAVLPVFIYLIVKFRKNCKFILFNIASYFLVLLLIYGPIFSTLNISKHDNIVGEVTGVPMAMMANAYIKESEALPLEVKDFFCSVVNPDELRELYIVGEWDSCRWNMGGTELLREESLSKIIKLTIMTIYYCPQSSFESLKENTRIVWQILGDSDWEPWVYIEHPNEYEIIEKPVWFFKNIVNIIVYVSHSTLACSFVWNIGLYIAVIGILFVGLSAKGKYSRMIFGVPLLTYALGTMCLLGGPNQRYFYYFSVLFLPVIILLLIDQSEEVKYD